MGHEASTAYALDFADTVGALPRIYRLFYTTHIIRRYENPRTGFLVRGFLYLYGITDYFPKCPELANSSIRNMNDIVPIR